MEARSIEVCGIDIAWNPQHGTCTFEGLPVAMMWVDSTLAEMMAGLQTMVGAERFALALQSEGRKSVETDWAVISKHADFGNGFKAIANIAAVAGWGRWTLTSFDEKNKECGFRVTESWEGRYQRALGVCWGSGMLAGKLAGYCSKLFGTNCWADQTLFIAKGDSCDEFLVKPSARSIEREIENLLATDEATRADMAVALRKLEQEIAERTRAEKKIAEEAIFRRILFERSRDGIAVLALDGRVYEANIAFSRMLGYTRDEVSRMHVWDWDAQWTQGQLMDNLRALSVADDTFETLYRRKDGSIYEVEVSVNGTEINEQILLYCVHRDISSRKRAEAEKEKLQEQLIHAQKMEAIGQLAGGIAHDFNNLLQVITGYADIAAAALNSDHPTRESILEIARAGGRATQLVSQLLAFSRRQIMRPENLDINEVISHLLSMLERIIGEHIHLNFIPGYQLGTISADRNMMEQVLMNLCVNARDAIGSEGELTIETGNVLLNNEFCAINPWAKPGRYMLLIVTDTGCGMNTETQAHIFEPFFTTKDKSKGTGLGLATVYGILRQHEGMIRVYSEPGKGAAFKVYLPVTEQVAQHVIARGEARLVGGTETILLAEDDENVRNLAIRILSQAGYKVIAAKNGAEALMLFKENADTLDLLLLDVVMPGMGGREVFDQVQRIKPGIPALFTSGYTENAIHTDFVLKEEMNLLQKPYNSKELLRQIRQILDA